MTDPADHLLTVELVDGWLVEFAWTTGTLITPELAEIAVHRYREVAGGAGCPLLVVMNAQAQLSRGARDAFAGTGGIPRIALLGSNAVTRVIANVALGRGAYPFPIRFFSDRDEAVAWLADARPRNGSGAPPDLLA